MLTCNIVSGRMEIRNVCDVSERIDRVISSFKFHQGRPYSLAVSNNQKFVAYSFGNSCIVYIADALNGNVLRTLFDLEEWALSLTPDEQDVRSILTSSGHSSRTPRVGPNRQVGTLSFSSDGNMISAFAAANWDLNPNPDPNPDRFYRYLTTVEAKSVSWSVSSGVPIDETHVDADSTATSSTPSPRLVCNPQFDRSLFRFPPNVKYEHGQSSFTIATVEDHVSRAHYIADTSRLHLSKGRRSMCYVDLITHNTHLPPRNPPPLPLLPEPRPSPSQNKITNSGPEEV